MIIIVGIIICLNNTQKNYNEKKITYNGKNLLISIDGETSNTLPTSGNYYLVSYDCNNKDTKITWDRENYELNINNNNNNETGVLCALNFESKPLLSRMEIGSYVAYEGPGGKVGNTNVNCKKNGSASSSTSIDETEAPNSCLGQNAREDLDTSGYTYRYCYSNSNRYYTTGWRIAYIDNNNPVIVSAGSPECNARGNVTSNTTYIKQANTKAIKYCNSDLVDGNCSCTDSDSDGYCDCTDSDSDGLCDEIENGTVDAWAINDRDFYNITKNISVYGKRLTEGSSGLGDSGGSLGTTLYCDDKLSHEECGYNNDLIDNGGFYWFATRYNSTSPDGIDWFANYRYISRSSYTSADGLRPVISLSSSIVVTGGKGTMEDPYIISNP